ncbi:MAG: hypothetical protein AAFO79_11325, partial [Pseudomonadota bacterium]
RLERGAITSPRGWALHATLKLRPWLLINRSAPTTSLFGFYATYSTVHRSNVQHTAQGERERPTCLPCKPAQRTGAAWASSAAIGAKSFTKSLSAEAFNARIERFFAPVLTDR